MDKQYQNLTFNGEHPPREQFLMFIDGELTAKETQQWEAHLAACWECRVQAAKFEGTIADIMEFENVVIKDYVSNSLGNKNDFNSKLNQLVTENQRPTWREKISTFWLHNRIGQFATASLSILLVFAIVFQFLPKTVSAGELFKRSKSSLSKRVLSVTKPIIYQKLKISTQNKSATLEVWNDVEGVRTKHKAADDEVTKEVLTQFEAALAENQIDILKSLSSDTYQNWSNQFEKKQETVTSTKTEKNENAFELSTNLNGNQGIGKITQTNLIFREADWHLVRGTISIKTANGNQVFEVSELTFRIIRGVSFKPDFFKEG
jgi:hypothetical protein